MPYASEKQKNTMEWAARDPKFAARKGIPQDVAKRYVKHDKGNSLGDMFRSKPKQKGKGK